MYKTKLTGLSYIQVLSCKSNKDMDFQHLFDLKMPPPPKKNQIILCGGINSLNSTTLLKNKSHSSIHLNNKRVFHSENRQNLCIFCMYVFIHVQAYIEITYRYDEKNLYGTTYLIQECHVCEQKRAMQFFKLPDKRFYNSPVSIKI